MSHFLEVLPNDLCYKYSFCYQDTWSVSIVFTLARGPSILREDPLFCTSHRHSQVGEDYTSGKVQDHN